MYRRFVQIAHKMSKDAVFEHYKHNDNHLSNDLSHIKVATVKPQLAAIKDLVATSGSKLVVVDTIDCIDVPFKNEMDKLKAIATELSSIAQQFNIIIFGISHISKKAAYGGALDVHSASGPGTIEHRSDKVITIEGDLKANYRVVRSQKARDEAPFQLATVYDTNTFRFDQVTF
jgi:predicted ATP-dependent serine protease